MYYKVDQKVNRLSMHAWSSKYDLLVEFFGISWLLQLKCNVYKNAVIVYYFDLDVIIE